jgi:hypothetical protein
LTLPGGAHTVEALRITTVAFTRREGAPTDQEVG